MLYFGNKRYSGHLLVGILLLLGQFRWAFASSSYESVRSLDSYGNAVQLQHAQAAAKQHGRLVICIEIPSGSLLEEEGEEVTELLLMTIQPSGSDTSLSYLRPKPPKISNLLYPSEFSESCRFRALVCSGVQADAQYLLQEMRQYHRDMWETYNDAQCSGQMDASLQALQILLRKFWQYDEREMRSHRRVGESGNWARPMGIQTLLLRSGTTANSRHSPKVIRVEPSGVVSSDAHAFCHCIGKHSTEVESSLRSQLSKLTDQSMRDTSKIVSLVQETLSRHLGSARSLGLVVERISNRGNVSVEVTVIP